MQWIKEIIKYRKFIVPSDDVFEVVYVGNCYMAVVNGQIYIGECYENKEPKKKKKLTANDL